MAKGKKQKPTKRAARRVEDDRLPHGGVGESTDDGVDEELESREGVDEGDDEGNDDGLGDEASDETSAPARGAWGAKRDSDTTRLSDDKRVEKSSGLPTEMPVTQTSEKGPVVFLAVIFGLLGLAIAVGFLTN